MSEEFNLSRELMEDYAEAGCFITAPNAESAESLVRHMTVKQKRSGKFIGYCPECGLMAAEFDMVEPGKYFCIRCEKNYKKPSSVNKESFSRLVGGI